ncbi:RNA-binding S4 domain protein [Desulforamulus reducens MI-1]|uniref:RNA-binding S4 domain protein n=1 Tax=Desulforamulus reducens (strain ATCC BAA-1160 / DSM 100696 / MI-1) TaxID=349161 RepID=A4J0F2_DESRM|nr:RNA-binding S4 domain-containing protein [Desulforamulus reducens]ABO48555.1 RNA-binding S4 domain protein [Desulforamulus reducens MI-1]
MTQPIKVNKDIRLDQFLKWANITGSGGESKILIQSGHVKVNGITEIRRGKKLQSNDIVEVDGAGNFLVVM